MAVKVESDPNQENKLNNESTDINKKFVGSMDKKESHSTAKASLHNDIHNRFISYTKTKKMMGDAYFKATLTTVYSEIHKKNLVWKNIPIEADVQINIKKILKDTSYVRVYNILKHYSSEAEKDMLDNKELINVTAMFYTALYFFVKREFEE